MKKLFLLLFLSATSLAISQNKKFKYNTIYSKGLGVNYVEISVREDLDEQNNIVSNEFNLILQDINFKHITNRITCYSGDADGLIKFLDDLKSFYDTNEKGVYLEYGSLFLRAARQGVGVTFKGNQNEVGFYHKDFIKLKGSVEQYIKKQKT